MSTVTSDPDLLADTPLGHDRPLWQALVPVAVALLPLALVPVFVGDSRTYMGVAAGVLVAAGYAAGFNVVFGMTGQLFLCVGALGGVGGYTTAILADDRGWPWLLAMAVGTALAAVLGALFCWLSVRRSLDVIFTGIVTLTFALGFDNLLIGQGEVTGGEDGRRVTSAGDTVLDDIVGGYYVLLAALALFLVVFRWLERSHHGWAYRALHDDETTAELAGVDVARYRVHAGAVGAAMIGLMGGLYALTEGRITPTAYGFAEVDVESLVILALGGIGQLLAPVVGAVAFGLLDEFLLRDLGTLRIVVYGAVLLTLFLTLRDGVIGTTRRILARRGA